MNRAESVNWLVTRIVRNSSALIIGLGTAILVFHYIGAGVPSPVALKAAFGVIGAIIAYGMAGGYVIA